jgi:hypothetical protein
MIKYSLTLDKVDERSIHIIFTLMFLGYVIKNSRLVFSRDIDKPNNSDEIDLIKFIATRLDHTIDIQ